MKNRLSGRVCAAWAATFGRASSIVIRELVRPHNRCRWFGNTVNMKKQITVRGLSSTTDVRTCVLRLPLSRAWDREALGLGAG